MATVPVTRISFLGSIILRWVLGNGDVGAVATMPGAGHDRSVHLYGTPGVGFGIVIEGSDEASMAPANLVTLRDPFNTALSYTTLPQLRTILDPCLHVRPRNTGGDGTTSVTVDIFTPGSRR